MAAGLSVVSTRHAGIPDVVIENETGFLVDEGDIVQMANHIITIVEDRNLAAKMGANGKDRILNGYTMERHITKLDKIIEVAINSKQS
jgi:glycosyltransferase involved in cell wall biosynthesis